MSDAVSMNLAQCKPCQRSNHCNRCSCCIPIAQLKRVVRKLRQWDKTRSKEQHAVPRGKREPRFPVGQVVANRISGTVAKIQFIYRDSNGKDWWYEMYEDATPWGEAEIRKLSKRERGAVAGKLGTGRKG